MAFPIETPLIKREQRFSVVGFGRSECVCAPFAKWPSETRFGSDSVVALDSVQLRVIREGRCGVLDHSEDSSVMRWLWLCSLV